MRGWLVAMTQKSFVVVKVFLCRNDERSSHTARCVSPARTFIHPSGWATQLSTEHRPGLSWVLGTEWLEVT